MRVSYTLNSKNLEAGQCTIYFPYQRQKRKVFMREIGGQIKVNGHLLILTYAV